MNIFATDPDPIVCARNLDDKRVVKLTLEAAQLLCSSMHDRDGDAPYKDIGRQCPWFIEWLRSDVNYAWLHQHFCALTAEYNHRYDRIHKCTELLPDLLLINVPDPRPDSFVNKAANKKKGVDLTAIDDVHNAYRLYLNVRWSTDIRAPLWTNRDKPSWAKFVRE